MKVSRKVGRRSRSSVSRRRLRNKKTKSGYKKKYAKTQKGGKRGHSYKRVRTHKRGRRFHRGGFTCGSLTTKDYDDDGGRRIYYGDTWITYNKKGCTEFSSLFKVCFEIKFMQESIVRITIIFTRTPTPELPKSPTFVFYLICKYSEVFTFLDRILEPFTSDHITESDKEYNYESGILQQKTNVKKPLSKYRFTSQENTEIFKTIIGCIKIKLRKYFEDKHPGMSFRENFIAIPSAAKPSQVNSGSVDYTPSQAIPSQVNSDSDSLAMPSEVNSDSGSVNYTEWVQIDNSDL